MDNNDIFKKLLVALQLRDDQFVEILELVDFRISKAELGAFFRNADHPNYMECGDQVLRNFLNALIIHLRGTKEAPKNPTEVLSQNKAAISKAGTEKLVVRKPAKDSGNGNAARSNPKNASPKSPAKNTKPREKKPVPVVEKVKFKNGKNKKS